MAEELRLTVVRGGPDEVELAAVTAVLLARLRERQREADDPAPAPRANWERSRPRQPQQSADVRGRR
ncbi:acyl-CoA carboxylase subunit epsilon [Streptomyces sparsus]